VIFSNFIISGRKAVLISRPARPKKLTDCATVCKQVGVIRINPSPMIANPKFYIKSIPPECSLYLQDLRFRSCP
jgi:hypothetical protein